MTSPRTCARSSSRPPRVVTVAIRFPLTSCGRPLVVLSTRLTGLGVSCKLRCSDAPQVAREAPERAVLTEQLALRAALNDAAVLDDEDLVGAADRRQAVRDDDRRAAVEQAVERPLDQDLRGPVDVGRR